MTKANTSTNDVNHAEGRPVVVKGGVRKIHGGIRPVRTIIFKVAGVTFENRQALLEMCAEAGVTTCTVQAEPVPGIDPNAKSVRVQVDGESYHIGFVPRRLTSIVEVGRAQVLELATFDADGSSVYYCRVRAARV